MNAVDDQSPWLGLASFTEETRSYFHGREEEVAELGRRVQRKLLTVLFGQSGLGKTSILRAGLVPRLRPGGYCPVYVRIDYAPESPPPAEQIKQAIFRATGAEGGRWTQPGSSVAGESLWEFLHHRDDLLKDEGGNTVVPLLIFDQFEEIFTIAQSDSTVRERATEFLSELADLVENRPPKELEARLETDDSLIARFDFSRADYRILISLREDYLAHLEGVKASMPSITQNRMRIARMTGDQALAAVTRPGGKLVTQEVAESIVRFVAGGAELRNAEVEPALLSLICRELNNARISQDRNEITADLLAGSHDTILLEFYERALADQPLALRHFIEDAMLTESGYRESLAEERVVNAFVAAGAAPDALATLVNRRLLRVEERLDARRVELTHDVLCAVVKASRDVRHERETRDAAQRQLAEQKAREESTRAALQRARKVAAGCAVLAVVAVAGGVFGWFSMKRAQDAEAKALATRQVAETSRGEAEKLVVYLLDDFFQELEPVGRLDIVGDLSKRALAYYAGLPPELRSPESERNRALALVRYAHVLRYQANPVEATKLFKEANTVLEKLRANGDQSEFTAIGLALGYTGLTRALDMTGSTPEAEKMASRSTELLAPLAQAPNPSVRLRLVYGNSLNFLGYSQLRQANEEGALKTLDLARATYRSIDGLKLTNLAAAAGFAESSAWLTEALVARGRAQDAGRVADEALKVAQDVLDKRPGHMPALRAHGLLATSLGRIAAEDLRIGRGIQLATPAIGDWETFLKLDPSNFYAWNNLAATHAALASANDALGRGDEARAHVRKVIELAKRFPALNGFRFAVGRQAVLDAELGIKLPAGTVPDYRRMSELAAAALPEGSFAWFLTRGLAGYFDRQVALARGQFQEALVGAKTLLDGATSKPTGDGQRRVLARGLSSAEFDAAYASFMLKDYVGSEAHARRSLELQAKVTGLALDDQVTVNGGNVMLAMAMARNGKAAEAARLLEPALKFFRDLQARGSDDQYQRFGLAQGLYAMALADPPHAPALLAEANSTLDRLTGDFPRRWSVQLQRRMIAEEMKGSR